MNIIYEINNIPILDIAKRLGINVRKNCSLCFMHNDHHPSLSFSINKNLWKCFVCDIGGNSITLVGKYLNKSKSEAIKWISGEFGLSNSNRFSLNYTKKQIPIKKITSELKNIACEIDSNVYENFISHCNLSEKGIQYLKNRGFNKKIISRFNIKDIDKEIPIIEKKLLCKYSIERLINSGLMKTRKGKPCLIWWDHTLLFPFYNKNKRIVYIQGRRLNSNNMPKYINLCNISKPLYNHYILNNLQDGDILCICEGIPDTIMATQIGYNAVGVLGSSSFKKEWIDDLLNYKIIMIPDGDDAGKKFCNTVKNMFLEKGKFIEEVSMPNGFDLTSYVGREIK